MLIKQSPSNPFLGLLAACHWLIYCFCKLKFDVNFPFSLRKLATLQSFVDDQKMGQTLKIFSLLARKTGFEAFLPSVIDGNKIVRRNWWQKKSIQPLSFSPMCSKVRFRAGCRTNNEGDVFGGLRMESKYGRRKMICQDESLNGEKMNADLFCGDEKDFK